MSLRDRRVVITRAPHQIEEFERLLTEAGAIPVRYPCIDIAPPDDPTALDDGLHDLNMYDWVVLTSRNTVRALAQRIQAQGIMPAWSAVKLAVVGNATANISAEQLGKHADFIPQDYTGAQLAQEMPLHAGQRVWLPQSALAGDDLAQALRAQGAQVTVCDAYQNTIGSGGDDLPTLLDNDQVDAITFTSGSTVTGLLERIAPRQPFDLLTVCIGPSTQAVALEAGFQRVHHPQTYTLIDMVQLLHDLFQEVTHGTS
ncbi:MAG: uroporphyrinogen-III synthase [Anaerolineae bacterium]